MPGCDGAGTAEKSCPVSEVGAAARRSHLTPEARVGDLEEPP